MEHIDFPSCSVGRFTAKTCVSLDSVTSVNKNKKGGNNYAPAQGERIKIKFPDNDGRPQVIGEATNFKLTRRSSRTERAKR